MGGLNSSIFKQCPPCGEILCKEIHNYPSRLQNNGWACYNLDLTLIHRVHFTWSWFYNLYTSLIHDVVDLTSMLIFSLKHGYASMKEDSNLTHWFFFLKFRILLHSAWFQLSIPSTYYILFFPSSFFLIYYIIRVSYLALFGYSWPLLNWLVI